MPGVRTKILDLDAKSLLPHEILGPIELPTCKPFYSIITHPPVAPLLLMSMLDSFLLKKNRNAATYTNYTLDHTTLIASDITKDNR